MISKQIFSLDFMFLRSLVEELCTKEENDKKGCNFNFGHKCINCSVKVAGQYLSRNLKIK